MEIIEGLLDLPLWSILLTCVILLAYFYSTWTYSTWSGQGVKGARPWPVLGTFLPIIKAGGFVHHDPVAIKKYGTIIGAYRGRCPILEVGDPEFLRLAYIKEFNNMPNRSEFSADSVLGKMMTSLTDDRWRHVRGAVTPTFTSGKLKQMVGRINDCAQTLVTYLREIQSQPFDSKERMGAFTMDVISSTAFGVQVDSQANPNHPMIQYASDLFRSNLKPGIYTRIKSGLRVLTFMVSPAFLIRFLIRSNLLVLDNAATKYFVGVTNQIIDGRSGTGSDAGIEHKDFIQLCLNQLIEDPKPGQPDTKLDKFGSPWSTKGLTRDEIVANAILFYIAGFETTAATLNFTCYELAMHPEVQQKCVDEINVVLGEKALDAPLTYDEISKMEYLEWCINETMRIYPAAPRVERLVDRECVVGGVTIPAGCYVSALIYGIHHNPEIWPEPEKYDPERFSPENREGQHQCAWVPFGIGNRNCIGMRLALLEMKIAIVSMLRNFVLEQCAETPSRPLQIAKNFRMQPEKKIMLKFSPRQSRI